MNEKRASGLLMLAAAMWGSSFVASKYCMNIGMQTFEEIDANVDFFEGKATADEILERLHIRKRHMMIHDWCEGCGQCAARCKQQAISIKEGRAVIDPSKCVFCGYCARVCPQFCIKVV